MVIELSKEVDCVRIGIDKYSVRTGLKFRSIMVVSTRVLKEPRGFIRILQCILAILAFSTTAAFSTTCSFTIKCPDKELEAVSYDFGYPFKFPDNALMIPTCEPDENGNGANNGDDNEDDDDHDKVHLPFDFSSSASFFVATGVITFLYTIAILVVYIFFYQQYSSDPKLPVVDLAITTILSIFWLAGSSAWAQGVTDLKYYLDPHNIIGMLTVCSPNHHDNCKTLSEGHYAALNVSLIFGFACFLIWIGSMWFIYKETIFHTPAETANETTQKQNDGRV